MLLLLAALIFKIVLVQRQVHVLLCSCGSLFSLFGHLSVFASQRGEFQIFGIRTGEFLTPEEGAEAAKALQPTGLYDCLRTCDIYVRLLDLIIPFVFNADSFIL